MHASVLSKRPIAVKEEEEAECYVISSTLLSDLAPVVRPRVVARRSAQLGAGAFSKPHGNVFSDPAGCLIVFVD